MFKKTIKLCAVLTFSMFLALFAILLGLDPKFYFIFGVAMVYFWDNFWDNVVEIVKWWRSQPPFKGFWYWIEISFWKRHRKEKRNVKS